MQYTVSRQIDAPLGAVFATVSHIHRFAQAIPDIRQVEVLTDGDYGVGTRFRETRLMNGREATVELEVTEFVTDDRIRLVSEAGGTTWDSCFAVHQAAGRTVLSLTMEGRPHTLLARLTTPLIKGVIQRALEKDMDAVKAYCEQAG